MVYIFFSYFFYGNLFQDWNLLHHKYSGYWNILGTDKS